MDEPVIKLTPQKQVTHCSAPECTEQGIYESVDIIEHNSVYTGKCSSYATKVYLFCKNHYPGAINHIERIDHL